jgi:hypothetical protein
MGVYRIRGTIFEDEFWIVNFVIKIFQRTCCLSGPGYTSVQRHDRQLIITIEKARSGVRYQVARHSDVSILHRRILLALSLRNTPSSLNVLL